jgi:hypothetical protein
LVSPRVPEISGPALGGFVERGRGEGETLRGEDGASVVFKAVINGERE